MPPATTAPASSATPTPTSDSAASSTTARGSAAGPGAAQVDETLPPASSDNTAYSIDFDALLGGGKHDEPDLSALDDAETVDAVRSEDVDGPSDFTQNMEFWMRAKLPLEQRDSRLKKGEGAYGTRVAAAMAQQAAGEDTVDEEDEEAEDDDGGEGLVPRPARSAAASFNSRDHVSDSEGEDDENAAGVHGGEEEHEGSFEYAPSEQGEDTREVAAAAMQDLHGYVISDEDTFSPQSEQGSIDEQIDILSSMDDVNEEEYRSVPASPQPPQPPQRGWKQDTPAPKMSWLQPTVEDHEDTPPPLSARPSPRSPGGQTPEVLVEDYEGRLRTQGEGGRPELSRNGSYKPDLAPDSRTASSKSNLDEDADDLRAQISRLRRELERQREDFTSRIASLESQLQRTRVERDESRENEQRRVRDLNAQHNDRTKDLEDHWQRRLTMAQERYEQDVQEQKTSFALVKSSFESRLSATESGLQGQIAQKEAELDAARSTHKQELDQQRAGHDAKVASLEERVNSLQSALAASATRDAGPNDGQLNAAAAAAAATDNALAQQKAEYDARVAELEARLAATQSHLDASRAASLPSSSSRPSTTAGAVPEDQSDELLARAKAQIADLEANMALLASQLSSARRETSALRSDADSGRESARVLRTELEAARAAAAEQERAARARQVGDEEAAGAARRDGERMLENARREVEAARREKEEMKRRAEEAVRKAGTMLNGERIEKKGLRQALEGVRAEVDVLRRQLEARKREVASTAGAAAAAEEEEREGDADDETTTTTTTATAATSPRSSELESLRRALRDVSAAAKQAQREAREAREEAVRVRDDFVDVNRAMDERVVLLMRAREKEWQDRVAALAREKRELVKEKKALGRALLQEWGREEVGEGEPQAYRYKFVKRS